MTTSSAAIANAATNAPLQYEKLAESFNQALLHTLRKHSIADTFLDYWVPDADPVLGIAGMADSARIAGHSEIAIQFHTSTIPEARLPELEKALRRFSKVTLERRNDGIVLRATAMSKRSTDRTDAKASGDQTGPNYWHADNVSMLPAADVSQELWDTSELPEFGDVHPHFRSGLVTALANVTHEDEDNPVTSGRIRVSGREGSANLILDVDSKTHVVTAARHSGVIKPSERAALDLFCRTAEGLPIQEVADHVGPKVLNSLVDDDKAPPVKGILLPINAGAPFALAPRLARQAYDSYRAQAALANTGNFYYAPPTAAWQKLTPTDRRDKFEGSLRGFLQSEQLYSDDMQLLRLEKTKNGYEVRAVITFSERIKVEDKPFLLRRLEQRARRDIEPELELIAERAKDSSPLRRLS